MHQVLHKYMPYVVACASVGVAMLLILIVPAFVDRGAFILCLAAVSVTAWYGGWGPATVATLLSALGMAWFVLPPHDSIRINSGLDLLRLALFLLVAILISTLYTQRNRTQKALKRSQERLALALDAANMGAWEYNLRTKEFYWLPGMERLFGRSPHEFPASFQEFLQYIHPEDQDFLTRAVTQPTDGGKSFRIEHRIVLPDGSLRRIVTLGRILLGEDGQIERMVAVAAVVTASEKTSIASPAELNPPPSI